MQTIRHTSVSEDVDSKVKTYISLMDEASHIIQSGLKSLELLPEISNNEEI